MVETLKYWHRVEFFIPFDLQRRVLDETGPNRAVRTLTSGELAVIDGADLWRDTTSPDRRLTGFELYLGIFDRSELVNAACLAMEANGNGMPDEQDEALKLEHESRAELEGLTCHARLRVDARGEPLFDDVSVSTAPWAVGRMQHSGVDALDFDAFISAGEALKLDLRTFLAERLDAGPAADEADGDMAIGDDSADDVEAREPPRPLTGSELLDLIALIEAWSGFGPSERDARQPVIAIRSQSQRIREDEDACEASGEPERPDSVAAGRVSAHGADGGDMDITILNSFYATDIARVISAVRTGQAGAALSAYLDGAHRSQRIDLYSDRGAGCIVDMVHPSRLPHGRWLNAASRSMSLMQQFAINAAFDRLATAGLFSINGPPGTGKTTLLSDMVAGIVVRRARVLAGLSTARDAFQPATISVGFDSADDPCSVVRLREDLCGHEMVVASSNNAAVENISKALPRTGAIEPPGDADDAVSSQRRGAAGIGYLQTVAHNVAARRPDGDYDVLPDDDVPWGLICCTLGRRAYRREFAGRLAFDGSGKTGSDSRPRHFDPQLHQSIWQWRNRKGSKPGAAMPFRQAKEAFMVAHRLVDDRLDQLQRWIDLQRDLVAAADDCDRKLDSVRQAQAAVTAHEHDLQALERERQLCLSQLELLRAQASLVESRRPRPLAWARLWRTAAWRRYADATRDNEAAQLQWLAREQLVDLKRFEVERDLTASKSCLDECRRGLDATEQRRSLLDDEQRRLGPHFAKANRPPTNANLDEARWQIDGLWRDDELNALRSRLFAVALELHEAWLGEVMQSKGGFGPNVVALVRMLKGVRLTDPSHALILWQSLFMIVPVVSSTFASMADQFRELGAQSIGWLFIDEAGQAVPQAAVGSLWRARRALVVGDPLQIEPVFTVPMGVLDALKRDIELPADRDVAPHRVSVQTLADEANGLGAWLTGHGDQRTWVGSPLRVHRRCHDPMFHVSNRIAYDGRMIHATRPVAPRPSLSRDRGAAGRPWAAWVDVAGRATLKQMVQAQTDIVLEALIARHAAAGALPDLYVITPFRSIAEALRRRCGSHQDWLAASRSNPPGGAALKQWCRTHIGTVHTFQGREADAVWFVLGCDADRRSAASWAASKPNLLNVALTRARREFVFIGDSALWGGLDHFDHAHAGRFPRITPQAFVACQGASVTGATPAVAGPPP